MKKFQLKSLLISLSTTETSTTINITDEIVKRLCEVVDNVKSLISLEINLKHRLSITNESVSLIKDTLAKRNGFKRIRLHFEGTSVDALYARQLAKMLKTNCRIEDVVVAV